MNRKTTNKKQGFRDNFREAEAYLLKPDAKSGRPGLLEAFGDNDEALLIKVWQRTRGRDDSDLQQIWHHELRQLHRLGGYPGAADTIAQLYNSGEDDKGFYLVLNPGQRRPLQVLLDHAHATTSWLRNPRTPVARSRMWRNLKRIAAGVETLHVQGLLHRNLDNWAILTSGSDEPDFLLTGFEWSMRLIGSRSGSRSSKDGEPDSFIHDWMQFGALAAGLFHVDPKRLADLSIAPFAVADLSAGETRLLRDLRRLEFDDHIDGAVVGQRIDEIVEALGAESANRDAKLNLVFHLGDGSRLVDQIREDDPDIEADDLIALFDWIRGDIGDRPLLMAVAPWNAGDESRLVLHGRKLCYTLKPFQDWAAGLPSWEFGFCDGAEREPAQVNLIGQRILSLESLDLMTLKEGRERFSRSRGKVRSWADMRRSFDLLVEPRTRETEVHQALVLTQFLETLFAAAEVFPVEILSVPKDETRDESLLRVRYRVDREREQLSDALGLRKMARRFDAALTGDGLRREGWTLTDSKLLGERQPTDTDWKFERVVRQGGPDSYEFSGASPHEPGKEYFLVPADSVGRDVQFKRRIKAMRALADHSELLRMIVDPRRRLLDSHEQVVKDEAHSLLDASKQEALDELTRILPLYLLQGPPGVGKTFLVQDLAARRFREEPTIRMLMSAQSNAALDHLLEELAPALADATEEPLIVRCRPRDNQGPASPYDLDDQTRRILADFLGSPLAQASDPRLRGKLVTLAKEGKEPRRGEARPQYRAPATALRTFEGVVMRSANFVFATTNSAELERMIEEKSQFDWSVVEEAGKATGGELVSPMLLSHRRLMIGDHRQLPPFGSDQMIELLEKPEQVATALRVGQEFVGRALRDETTDDIIDQLEETDDIPGLSARAIGLVKMFEWMIEAEFVRQAKGRGGRPIARRLQQQHRMHPVIAQLVSDCFYDGALETHPSCSERFSMRPRPFQSRDAKRLPETPIVVIDMPPLQSTIGKKTGDRKPRWHNPDEVAAVVAVIRELQPVMGQTPTLAILSPYAEQVRRLRDVLDENSVHPDFRPATREDRFVETVDSFQGSEADVVIISLVRNNDHSNILSALGFLSEFRRMNVLVSRAKWQMIIIGSVEFLKEIVDAAQGTDDAVTIEFLNRMLVHLEAGRKRGEVAIIPASTLGLSA